MKYIYTLPLIGAISLFGCGSQSNNQSESLPQESQTNNSESLTQQKTETTVYESPLPEGSPVYTVATTGKQPPYSFLSDNGVLQGIDIDVMRLIGEKQGFKVQFVPTSWQEVFPSVVKGNKDMAISGISYNAERNDNYLLSKSYLFVPSALMYKDSKLTINGLQDLQGHRFAGMTGSKQLNDVKNHVNNVEIIETKTMFQAYELLVQDKTDAIAEDIHWLQYMAKSYPENTVEIVAYETEKDLSSQQIVMFKKGNDELAKSVNEGIDKLIATGKIDEIEKKWVNE